MCLILFALGQHPEFPLVLAANRDEFHARPTSPMHWWARGSVLAGRDERSGGTWLAVDSQGTVSAVTNVREPGAPSAPESRGVLPLKALSESPAELAMEMRQEGTRYGGFNLVRLQAQDGWYFSNRDPHPGRHLHRGAYGVSNELLQSPWPKLVKLRQEMIGLLHQSEGRGPDMMHQRLIEKLQDDTPAPDSLLPDTGIGLEAERFLSSPFIKGEKYGTRATTIVTVQRGGHIQVTEQSWRPGGIPGEQLRFSWQSC
ncbi:NRDE family protein [Marinobacter sp.]|uniref:NRDE family protein n=1 Tax=Marinobacter sp. TaxID=50741 RepID=UPI003850CFFA